MESVNTYRSQKILKWAILLSFLLHFVTISMKWISEHKVAVVEQETRIPIMLNPEPETRLAKKMQIVETQKKAKSEKPKDSRFLSHSDQSFDRQTVAKDIGSFKEAGLGVKNGVEDAKNSKSKTSAKNIKLSDLSFGRQQMASPESSLKQLGLTNGLAGIKGLGRNNDYVDDVPLGDITQLNTIEYKYYGFYHRIKQRLEQHWGKTLRNKAEALYKSGRKIASEEDKITSLAITLDEKGNITEIAVKSSSGVKELDDAAIESFNKAGPFPNPPKGMLRNGIAVIEWGFVVKS